MNLRTRFLHLGIALKVCLQGLSRRWWGSLNAVLGTATVVGMLAAVLGIAAATSARCTWPRSATT
jgi:hypothetical protein